MVILISGASHTGKTACAQKLLERYGFPYLSLDHLKMGLIRSGFTALTPESGDRDLTALLWPIAREIAKTAIENGQNLTIEGCYIPFDWRDDFDTRYLCELRCRFLVMSERYISSHFGSIASHANEIERRLDDSRCTPALLGSDNRHYLEGCRRRRCPYVLIDSEYPDDIVGALALEL